MFLTPIGGWKALNVLTGSMEPTIMPGTLVLIHHLPLHDIKVGDIVTYQDLRNFKRTITHRVVKIESIDGVTTLTVKGDANPAPDPPFPGGLVVGKVETIVPGAGRIISLLHNPWLLALIVIIPGLLVIWSEIRRLQRALAKPREVSSQLHRESDGANASDNHNHQDIHGEAPSSVVSAPKQTDTKPAVVRDQPQRPRRSMDGMRRISMLLLVSVVLALGIGSTFALGTIGTVGLTHNTFTALAPSPTPQPAPTSADQCKNGGWATFKNPDGSGMFKNQGQCVAYVNSANPGKHITSSTTTVTVTNSSKQSATTGSGTGRGPSGDASNANSASTGVNVTN
jgi:signal peptidase I